MLPPSATISPRVRKRQRLNVDVDHDVDHDDAMDTTGDDGSSARAPVRCGVELETAVERFLLRMYEAEADDDASSETEKEDDAGGVEKSKTVSVAQSDRRRWEIWLLGTLDDNRVRVTDGEGGDDVSKGGGGGGGGAVLLQRDLCASNLEFVEGEMRVLQETPNADSPGSCAREGWAIEVRRWRWAPVGPGRPIHDHVV